MADNEPQPRVSDADADTAPFDARAFGARVIATEITALQGLIAAMDEHFERAVNAILACRGSVVVMGVGKPWLIGQKISATLASTGTPSFALHPSEAAHGDLGRVTDRDIVLAISNSGASEEVVRILPVLKRFGVPIIGMTGRPESDLGRHSDMVLNMGRIEEACPLKLAPSASTTAMAALGDALALAVMEARGFTKEDYARFHPGGALGRKLMRVEEVMRPLDRSAVVAPSASVREALYAITQHKAGAACVVDEAGLLLGVFTDGDLRRRIESSLGAGADPFAGTIGAVMTAPGLRIAAGELAASALHLMQQRKIDELPVVDADGRLLGHIDVQDLLAVGMV